MSKKQSKQIAKLTKNDFSVFYGDVHPFKRIFGIFNEYELFLEPCDHGFEIALYWKKKFNERDLLGKKICTAMPGYDSGDEFHEKPRKDDVWEKALQIAEKLIDERVPKGVER